jgi:CheY-like chemotaxis protein
MRPVDVLLAEDNPGDVLLIDEALRLYVRNYTLKVVSNGEDASRVLNGIATDSNGRCPDIFLLDLNLPRASGFELLQLFRAVCGSEIPVVVITSSQAPSDMVRASQLGATRYFRKPSELDEYLHLGVVVDELVAGRTSCDGLS